MNREEILKTFIKEGAKITMIGVPDTLTINYVYDDCFGAENEHHGCVPAFKDYGKTWAFEGECLEVKHKRIVGVDPKGNTIVTGIHMYYVCKKNLAIWQEFNISGSSDFTESKARSPLFVNEADVKEWLTEYQAEQKKPSIAAQEFGIWARLAWFKGREDKNIRYNYEKLLIENRKLKADHEEFLEDFERLENIVAKFEIENKQLKLGLKLNMTSGLAFNRRK